MILLFYRETGEDTGNDYLFLFGLPEETGDGSLSPLSLRNNPEGSFSFLGDMV